MNNLQRWGLIWTLWLALVGVRAANDTSATDASAAAQVTQAERAFPEGLVWVGTQVPPVMESQKLLAIIEILSQPEWIPELKSFLEQHPTSAWSPSVHHVYASFCRRTGRTSEALNHWESAWNLLRADDSPAAQVLAGAVAANWLELLSSLGRMDTLERLLPEAEHLPVSDPDLRRKLAGAKDSYFLMRQHPGLSFRCGTLALKAVGQVLQPTNRQLEDLVQTPSPTNGFALSALQELARSVKVELEMARRPTGSEVVIPSVVHWKQNHYAALLGRTNSFVLVSDPTFGDPRWMPLDVVNQEASGAFLVPKESLPLSWERIPLPEASAIRGKGLPNNIKDEPDKGCERGFSGEDECPPCKGMPVWWVSEPYISLFIADEPLLYRTSTGEERRFRITYKQRDTRPNPSGGYNGGYVRNTGWNHTWNSFARITGEFPTPTPIFGNFRTVVYLPNGGELQFMGGQAFDPASGTRLETVNPNQASLVNSLENGLAGLRLIKADGSQTIFGAGVALNVILGDYPRVEFWWTREIDRDGQQTRLNYEAAGAGALRLKEVVDYDGRTNFFRYSTSHKLTEVENPYGKKATFTYNANGWLTNIVDAEGITSKLTYYTNGYPQTLITPYGTSSFVYLEQVEAGQGNFGGHDLVSRAITATEPTGAKHLYLYRYQASFLSDTVPSGERPQSTPLNTLDFGISGTNSLQYVSLRNSFYWGPRQYGLLGTTVVTNLNSTDYRWARRKHWLQDTNELYLSGQLSFVQDPAPDALTDGLKIFYDYPGKVYANRVGTNPIPHVQAWRIPNGPTYYEYKRFNEYGQMTNWVTTYTKTDGSVATRTNIWQYSANVYTNIVTNPVGSFKSTNTWTVPNLLLRQVGPDGATNWSYGGFDPVQWTNVFVDGSWGTNSVSLTSTRVRPRFATNGVLDVTEWTFTGLNKVLTLKSPTGLLTTNRYDGGGFLTNTVDLAINRTNSFAYGVNGMVTLQIDELGRRQTNIWDNLLRLRSAADERGYISNSYSALSLFAQRDRLGQWKDFAYDAANRLIAEINELGQATYYGWCGCGSLEYIINAAGETNTFTYDNQSRLIGVSYSTSPAISLSLQRDMAGRITNIVDNANVYVRVNYNNQSLPTQWTTSSGQVAKHLYDVRDRPIEITDAAGVTLTNAFDLLNRIISRRSPIGNAERFVYGAAGLRYYTNQLALNPLVLTYDLAGRVIAQTNQNLEVLQFGYNPAGLLTNLLDGRGKKTAWRFDQFGRVTNKLNDAGSTVWRLAYDANDRLTNRWTPAKLATTYRYDSASRLTNVVYNSSPAISARYDAMGRLTNLVDALGTSTFAYSPLGALTREDGPWVEDVVRATYGSAHRLSEVRIGHPSGPEFVQSFAYDTAGRLSISTTPSGVFSYGYLGASDWVRELISGNGVITTNAYDAAGRLRQRVARTSGGTALDSMGYGYNDAHWRTATTNFAGNRWAYGYQQAGQLTAANGFESGGTVRAHEKFTYGYDAAGNLTARTNNALIQSFTVDSYNQLATSSRSGTYTSAGSILGTPSSATINGGAATLYSDRSFARSGLSLTSGTNTFTAIALDADGRSATNVVQAWLPASVSFSYDANGNLLSDGRRAFEYDDENQLIRVTFANAWKSEFAYDGLGRRRVRREYVWANASWALAEEIRYLYDGMLVVQERDGYNVPRVTYTRGSDLSGRRAGAGGIGGLLARTDHFSGTQTYYHADAGGNITLLTDVQQRLAASYVYDPFGGLLQANGELAQANTYRFSSKEFHTPSATYYYGYRFYDPGLQRWLNRDPIEEAGGFNLFRFVNNAPLNYVDPDGLWQFTIYGGVGVGGYVSFGYNGGQWNFGGRVGGGKGLAASLNLVNTGESTPGFAGHLGLAAGGGLGIAGGGGEFGLVVPGGLVASADCRLGPITVGPKMALPLPNLSPQIEFGPGAGFSDYNWKNPWRAGGGIFFGGGASYTSQGNVPKSY